MKKILNRYENFKKEGKKKTVGAAETRMSKVMEWWNSLESNHKAILKKAEAEQDHDYFVKGFIDEAEEIYLDVISDFKEYLLNKSYIRVQSQVREGGASQVLVSEIQSVRLDPIKVKVFGRKATDWYKFHDLFTLTGAADTLIREYTSDL